MDITKSENTKEFLRLILLSYDISLNVTKVFTKYNILPPYNNSLSDFLTSHVHEIYHLWINNTRCCQGSCNVVQLNRGKAINKDQFLKLYSLPNNSIPGHLIKHQHSIVKQYCICGLSVNSICSLDELDLTLLHTLIQNCCKTNPDDGMWLHTIRKIRNKLVHVESVTDFNPGQLQRWWEKLEGSVIGLASKILSVPEYKQSIKNQLYYLKMASFNVDKSNEIFNQLKTDNRKLKDMVVNEHELTRCIVFEQIGKIRDEIIDELRIQIQDLTFYIRQHIQNTNIPVISGEDSVEVGNQTLTTSSLDPVEVGNQSLTTRKEKQTAGMSNRCYVVWKLQTPSSWKDSHIATILQGTNQLLKHWFRVGCAYVGSLVIVTSITIDILQDSELLSSAIRAFLLYMVNICELDADKTETIPVDITIRDKDDMYANKEDIKSMDLTYPPKSIEFEQDDYRSRPTDVNIDSSSTIPTTEQQSPLNLQCDVCQSIDLRNQASAWCFECNETFCCDCQHIHGLLKMSKAHQTIRIDNYLKLPSSVINVNQDCIRHRIKLEFYCSHHDSLGCAKCITELHHTCRNVKPISEITHNVKASVLFTDLTETANEIIEITHRLITEMTADIENVRAQNQQVISEVDDARVATNNRLEEIHNELLRKISLAERSEINRITNTVLNLENIHKRTAQIANDLLQASNYASEFNTFCSIKTWSKELKREEEELILLQSNLKRFEHVRFQVSTNINHFQTKIKKFGNFEMMYRKHEVTSLKTERQSQDIVRGTTELAAINLSQYLSITLPSDNNLTLITGCCVIDSGTMVFADQINSRLVVIDTYGNFIKEILLEMQPFDVAAVDNETVAVTCTWGNRLVLVDINSSKVIRTVYEGEGTYGVCYSGGKFIVSVQSQKIKIVDFDGKVLLVIDTFGHATYCCVANDSLYCAAHRECTVYCCDMTGKVKWKYSFVDRDYPCGIAADSQGNVFVTCKFGNKVIVIDKNGKNSKVLMTHKNGINNPLAICYNLERNVLLVCNYFDERGFVMKPN